MASTTTVHTKFGKICRVCLKQRDDMVNLFDTICEDNRTFNIAEKIVSLAQVEVLAEDDLPNYICQSCEKQVHNFYEFQALILESDQTLRTCLDSLETNTQYKIEKLALNQPEDVDYEFIEIPVEQSENDEIKMDILWVPTFTNSKVWKSRAGTEVQAEVTNDENPTKKKPTSVTEVITRSTPQSLHDSDSRRTKVQRYFKCYCCEQIFMSEDERKEHMMKHMQKPEHISVEVLIKCQVCEMPFQDEYELKNHIVSHFTDIPKNPNARPAKVQLKENPTDHSYQTSKATVATTRVGRYKCSSCAKPFKSKSKMEEHEKTHSDLVYKCKLCSKVFSKSTTLNQHLLYHMRNRKFECNLCDKVFTKRTELRYHKGTHLDSTPTCDICSKTFQNVQSLKMHLKRHEMGDRFTCEHCGKRYFTNSELARHVQTHTGERNFPCNLCDMSFMSKPELTRHLKYHGGDKKWACELCNKRYFESGHLKVHMKSHTGEKPFVCQVCNKAFVTKCKMERHARIHERIIEIPEGDDLLPEME